MRPIDKAKMVQKGVEKAKEFRKSAGPISGVIGGIADYTGFPPLLLRVATVIAVFPLFWAIIPGYILLMILMPKANRDYKRDYTENRKAQIVQKFSSDISCPNCGEQNEANKNYCRHCSKPLY